MTTGVETYLETDADVADVNAGALAFILESDDLGEPFDLRGLCVFGVAGMLRENYERFFGENPEIDDDQRQRAEIVASRVEEALDRDMHYYPFGHKRTAEDYQLAGVDRRRLAMVRPSGSIPEIRPNRLRSTYDS